MTARLFYSGHERGFYDDVNELPPDAVEISQARFEELAHAQQLGRIIAPGPDGYPIAPERAPPTEEEIRARNAMERDDRLSAAGLQIAPLQDAVDLDLATEQERAQLVSLKTYRVQLSRMDLSSSNPEWPSFPEASS